MTEEMSSLRELGIARMKGNPGFIQKGSVPWNSGVRGYMGANRTSFTQETSEARAARSIGKPRMDNRFLICLTNDKVVRQDPRYKDKCYSFRKRKSYARFVYERETGQKVPSNCVVWHKDGDFTNNGIENLEVITRGESCRRTLLKRRTNGEG